ncbi:MAG: glycosyltransferase family 39 protein [Candidatus Xenobiia bacterium LiM19]
MKLFSYTLNNALDLEIPERRFTGVRSFVSARSAFFIYLALMALLTMVRLFSSKTIPISGDEAYYYRWSNFLSPGYYDHPPMIAWMIAFFSYIGGATVSMVRMGSILAALIYSIVIYILTKEMTGSDRTAFIAGLFLLAIPYFAVDSTMATPNAPLILFWSLYLYLAHKALKTGSRTLWIVSGIALGLSLQSKLMALFLPFSFILFLLISKEHRRQLLKPDFYLSLLAAALVVSPFLIWNYHHNWENLGFQLVERHQFPPKLNISHFTNFLSLQMIAVTPFFFVLYLISLFYCLKKGIKEQKDALLYCSCTSMPIFLFFVAVSLFERVEVYWPIAGYITGGICVAIFLGECADSAKRHLRIFSKLSLSFTFLILFLCTGALYFFALHPQNLIEASAKTCPRGEESFRGNSLIEMYAYEDLATELNSLQSDLGGKEKIFILTDNYSLSSALSYYSRQYIHIYSPFNLQGREYQKWEDYPSLKGMSALYVDRFPVEQRENMLRLFSQNFESINFLKPLVMKKNGRIIQTFYPVYLTGFKGSINFDNSIEYNGPLK